MSTQDYIPHYDIEIYEWRGRHYWSVSYGFTGPVRNFGSTPSYLEAVLEAFRWLLPDYTYTLTNGVFTESGVRRER